MKMRSLSVAPLVFLALGLVLVSAPDSAASDALHLRLERSQPAADSTVAAPSEVRLWFSQSTQEGATSIRVVDAAGEPVPIGKAEASEDHTVHHATLQQDLESGRYTVAWRTMAQDGHVVRGDFEFTVRATDRR